MNDPSTGTGRTKRWRQRFALLQNALRAKEALNRSLEAMDAIVRLLFEEELDETPLATLPPWTGEARPSDRPTQFQFPALDSNAFASLIRKRYAEARTDAQRQAVRDLVAKAHASKALDG